MGGNTEAEIQGDILLALGSRPDVRLWRANAGAAATPAGRVVRFGVAGQGDLTGLLRLPGGVGARLEVEVKREDGRQTIEQKTFQHVVEKFGGCYVLARSADEALAGVSAFLARHRGAA
jgi:hypothetical protein